MPEQGSGILRAQRTNTIWLRPRKMKHPLLPPALGKRSDRPHNQRYNQMTASRTHIWHDSDRRFRFSEDKRPVLSCHKTNSALAVQRDIIPKPHYLRSRSKVNCHIRTELHQLLLAQARLNLDNFASVGPEPLWLIAQSKAQQLHIILPRDLFRHHRNRPPWQPHNHYLNSSHL